MALPSELAASLASFRIPEDRDGLRQRQRIWKHLAPYLKTAIERHIDDVVENIVAFRQAGSARDAYCDLLFNHFEALFSRPFDDQAIIDTKARIATEAALGYTVRARTGIMQTIIGALLHGLQRTPWTPKRMILDSVDLATRLVAADAAIVSTLRHQAKTDEAKARSQELREAIGTFGKTAHEVRGLTKAAVISLRETARELAQSAQDGASQTATATLAANDTALNVARMANTTEELFASISSIRQQTTDSARMADDAVAQTGETNGTIISLSEAVEKIGSVVGLISEIANSTNMLALNATIEASRAGEAGKGFAVVAGEVKSLAKQTTQATQEIGRQIAMIQQAARHSVEQIGTSAKAIKGIAGIAEAVASSIEQQAGATGGIAEGIHGAARNATTVVDALRVIEDTVRRTHDASQAAIELAERLAESARHNGVAMDALFEAVARQEDMGKVAGLFEKTA